MSASAPNSSQALVILIVEDEFFVRLSIAACLRDEGYSVVETASGEEAIALCKSGTLIDLVFTDINLLGPASGFDVAECFRIERPDIPVIYTSGKSVDAERCVPGSTFVPKPYQSTDILRACDQLRAP